MFLLDITRGIFIVKGIYVLFERKRKIFLDKRSEKDKLIFFRCLSRQCVKDEWFESKSPLLSNTNCLYFFSRVIKEFFEMKFIELNVD